MPFAWPAPLPALGMRPLSAQPSPRLYLLEWQPQLLSPPALALPSIPPAPQWIDLSMRALDVVMGVMMLEKEREHAKLTTTVANYAAANTKALSGTNQWSHAESNPSQAVANARAGCSAAAGRY